MTAGTMLLHKNRRLLFVDGRYSEKAAKESYKNVKVLHVDDLNKTIKRFKQVRFEADDLTVSRLTRWKKRFRGTKLIPSTGVVEEMRRKKKPNELRAIQKACRITDGVMKSIPMLLNLHLNKRNPEFGTRNPDEKNPLSGFRIPDSGFRITERSLAWHIEQLSHDLGAESMAFDTIVSFGSHTSRPHHTPANRKLKKGDIIQIDMGVKVNGYCSDCSRVFFTGKPSDEQKQVFDLLCKTVKECEKRAKPGATNHSLDKLARKILKTEGYDKYFTHGLGHGVGLQIHEGARLSQRAALQKLKSNEVITIEPGIYIPGKWGMRVEDTILVTKNGGKRMTKAPSNDTIWVT